MTKKLALIISLACLFSLHTYAQPAGYTSCGSNPTFTEPTHVASVGSEGYVYLFNQIGPFTTQANTFFGTSGTNGSFWCQPVSAMDVATQAANLTTFFTALNDHITGTTPLFPQQILDIRTTIKDNISAIAVDSAVIEQAFALVKTFDTTVGALFLSGPTSYSNVPTLGRAIEYTMMYIEDALIRTYSSLRLEQFPDLYNGKKLATAIYFPGKVDPPTDPLNVYTRNVSASNSPRWGTEIYFHDTQPSRRPTGAYVAPGSIVKVIMPSSLVDKGFRIRVGAHYRDLNMRDTKKRLDRASIIYNVLNDTMTVGSPIGGNIYLEVPEGADEGVVSLKIIGSVRAPLFSATSVNQTTLADWQNTERLHPGAWADFESDKYQIQVPTKFIDDYDDPVTYMAEWDHAMDVINFLFGRPEIQGTHTMYRQVDVIMPYGFHSPGYPMINTTYNAKQNYDGTGNGSIFNPPNNPSYAVLHELGHSHNTTMFSGEVESIVNLNEVAVKNYGFGMSLDSAWSSIFGSNFSLTREDIANTWMIVDRFRQDLDMRGVEEMQYQRRGHGKYVDVARLFGWKALNRLNTKINEDYEKGIVFEKSNHPTDDRILRMSVAAGADLRPIIHFWGRSPANFDALYDSIVAAKLVPSQRIYDALEYYKTIVPKDLAEGQAHALTIYPGTGGDADGVPIEQQHWECYDSWDTTKANATIAQIQHLQDIYFPDGRPIDDIVRLLRADFEASSRAVLPGQVVALFDKSYGDSLVSWQWSFPGATPSSSIEQHPIITYDSLGTYDVTLIVTNDSSQTDTLFIPDYIRVYDTSTGWWNNAVFYEVYVRSFYDQDGDGIGDFKGLTEKLDYLNDADSSTHTDLGITGIYLMPVQESNSNDGYEITDYMSTESDYGTDDDFKTFIQEAHARGINVIIDYPMNHTSKDHPWFISSMDTTSDKRDWYRWEDAIPAEGVLDPQGDTIWHNNTTDYYYGANSTDKPDLNYTSDSAKAEMFDVAQYWVQQMGVDGFALSDAKHIAETDSTFENTDSTIAFWKEFRSHYKSIDTSIYGIGEAWTSTEEASMYVAQGGLDNCFEYDLSSTLISSVSNKSKSNISDQMKSSMGAYPFMQFGTFLSNHNMNRALDQLDGHPGKARLAAKLLLTMPGVPFIYYGEEIGMTGSMPEINTRTPLQWSSDAHAGFTTGTPWNAVNGDYATTNIADQKKDNISYWSVYQKMIRIRNDQAALRQGLYLKINAKNTIFSFLRQTENEAIIVVANLDNADPDVEISLGYSTLTPGNYTMVDLLSGATHDITISSNGGFSNENLGSIDNFRVALYKLFPVGQTSDEATFYVDMREMIKDGDFDPATQSVDMISDVNSWGTTLTLMEDLDGDSIYSVTVSDLGIGTTVKYKYRIDGVNDGTEEFSYSAYVREFLISDASNVIINPYQKGDPNSIKDNPLSEVLVYPVPAKDKLIIEFSEKTTGSVNMSIAELTGKVIKRKTLTNQITQLNVSNIPFGMYILTLTSEDGSVSKKIIVE